MTVTDEKKAKVLVQDYIAALREQGWTDDQILDDLKTELLRVSNENKNWSEWKEFVLKWTSDIKGWSKPSGTVQSIDRLRYEWTKHTDTLDVDIDFANEAFQVIKLFYDHFAGSTPEGWAALSSYIEDALLRFLLNMREEFHRLFGIHPITLKILGQDVADQTRQEVAREITKFSPGHRGLLPQTHVYVRRPGPVRQQERVDGPAQGRQGSSPQLADS